MATIYLKLKTGKGPLKSRDGAEHPNAILVLDDTQIVVGQSLTITANYFRSLSDYESGTEPIRYLSPVVYSYNAHTEKTYTLIVTSFIDVDLVTKEVTFKNEDVKLAILAKEDANGEALSVNWEFPS